MEAQERGTHHIVKTQAFEGPLAVLLELVEARKLFINDISLAEVAGEFLERMRALGAYTLEYGTGFIVVASTLVLIKSRSILPGLTLTKEEDEKVVDLERRLKLYQLVRSMSDGLRASIGTAWIGFGSGESIEIKTFVPDPQITPENLANVAHGVITALPKKVEPLPEVAVAHVMSIEEMMNGLTERIERAVNLSFSEITKDGTGTPKEKKVFTIVSFLALLELVREGIIDVLQNAQFADMTIEKGGEQSVTTL